MKKQQGSVSMIVVVAAAVVIVLGAGYWAWHRHHHGVIVEPAVGVCDPAHLQLSKGTSDGTAGTIYTHAVITNKGTTACSLAGYAAAFLLDAHGMVLGSGAASNALYAPVALIVSPGHSVHTVLGFPDAGNFSAGACTDTSTSLQLFLPGSIAAITTAWADHYCPGFSATALQDGA